MSTSNPKLTHLLNRMFQGDPDAGNQAMTVLYPALRRVASARLRREGPGHILDTQALVNEAMVRLFGSGAVVVVSRQHFFALACLLMKRILIDVGRRHRQDPVFVSLEESMAALQSGDRELIVAMDRILERLQQLDPEAHKALQLKVGAGMTSQEIADDVGCSAPTVNRALKRAKIWLFKEMRPLTTPRGPA